MQTQELSTSKGRGVAATGSQGRTTGAAHLTSANRLAMITFVVGAAVGAGSGWTASQVASADGTGPLSAPAKAAPAQAGGTAAGRSLLVTIPRADDYLTSATIPVAGTAFGRPHGPQIKSVHVELLAGGKVIDAADIAVYSGRFAGTLSTPGLVGRMDVDLRVTDALHPNRGVLVENVTVDPR